MESSKTGSGVPSSKSQGDTGLPPPIPAPILAPISDPILAPISASTSTQAYDSPYIYRNSTMVDDEERVLILKYAPFLSDVPRKIKRLFFVAKKSSFW